MIETKNHFQKFDDGKQHDCTIIYLNEQDDEPIQNKTTKVYALKTEDISNSS